MLKASAAIGRTFGGARMFSSGRGSPYAPRLWERPMFKAKAKAKAIALGGLGAALALFSVTASAQTGTSSSWGSYGYGQQIPTQALSPFDREWNHDYQSENEAAAGSEWLREHRGAGQRSWLPFP